MKKKIVSLNAKAENLPNFNEILNNNVRDNYHRKRNYCTSWTRAHPFYKIPTTFHTFLFHLSPERKLDTSPSEGSQTATFSFPRVRDKKEKKAGRHVYIYKTHPCHPASGAHQPRARCPRPGWSSLGIPAGRPRSAASRAACESRPAPSPSPSPSKTLCARWYISDLRPGFFSSRRC